MSEVKRYDMEKEYSLDIVVIPVEESDGSFVKYEDYAALKAQRDALAGITAGQLEKLAGSMLNRTLDSGSKQAVAYAECADMVAKFAAKLRAGEPS